MYRVIVYNYATFVQLLNKYNTIFRPNTGLSII